MNSNARNLWANLSNDGLYTKSFDVFSEQFSDPKSQSGLYAALNRDNLYTRSAGDFKNQFFEKRSTFGYTSPRKVKNKEDIISSLNWMMDSNTFEGNKELRDQTILNF